jgi:tRNA-specific 2-thiouridylase
VAAALLADEGHEVIGLSMQLYDHSAPSETAERGATAGRCCALEDLHDARQVAAALGIPHYVLNFERQFQEQVVSNFIAEYAAGRTPLPCARCNSDLKFSTLVERARGLGADAVATGHYARVDRPGPAGRSRLRRGLDPAKDQAYFLFSLTQDQLARAVFPVGAWSKTAVRDYARRRGLPVADKPDSQEICFVPDDDYAAFLAQRAPELPGGGTIVDEGGHVVGRHGGVHRFTVGQRKGLGLRSAAPLYVLELRAASREVVVGPRASLERTALTASGVNWIIEPPAAPLRVEAQIRHRHPAAAATVRATGQGAAAVTFDTPQIAVTPGQAVVFYDGEEVLGGGWIE